MNGQNPNEDILISRSEEYQYIFDQGAFLTVLASLAFAETSQHRLSEALKAIQLQDVAIAEVIKRSGTELAPLLVNFINTRIAENRESLKLKRLFSFLKPDRIEREASALAFQEANQLVKMVTLSQDPVFKKIVQDRQRLLREILDELTRLIERGRSIVINPNRIQEILSCLKDRRLLS